MTYKYCLCDQVMIFLNCKILKAEGENIYHEIFTFDYL